MPMHSEDILTDADRAAQQVAATQALSGRGLTPEQQAKLQDLASGRITSDEYRAWVLDGLKEEDK